MPDPADFSIDQQIAKLSAEIDQLFPHGRFVAIQSGQVVADAPTHRLLVEALQLKQLSSKDMLIVEAGVRYPQSATIFANWRGPTGHV